jgi:hypothetical protein
MGKVYKMEALRVFPTFRQIELFIGYYNSLTFFD